MAYITLADFSHKKELIDLWSQAFGDDERFISSFLEAYMIPGYNVPVMCNEYERSSYAVHTNRSIVDGKIVSALYLLNFDLYSNSEMLGECAYLFAAATKEGYKNSGHMSELIRYSVDLCRSRNQKAIFLFPQAQNPKLFDFYSKFGFESIYAAKKIKGTGKGGTAHNSFKLTEKAITDAEILDELYAAYTKFTAKQPLAPFKDKLFYLKCAESYLNTDEDPDTTAHFAVLESINEHNFEKFCYVFYKKSKNISYIDDIIFIKDKNILKTAEILADILSNSGDCMNFEINVPSLSPEDAQNTPLAMILPLDERIRGIIRKMETPGYINMFMNL